MVAPTGARWGTWGWLAFAIVAVLLPVENSAECFGRARTATPADLVAGVWILKVSLVALATCALLVRRHPARVVRVPAAREGVGANRWFILAAILVVALGLRLYRIDT